MPRIVSPASRHSRDSSLVKSSCSIYVRVDRALTFCKSGRLNHSGRYFAAVIRFDDLPRRVVSIRVHTDPSSTNSSEQTRKEILSREQRSRRNRGCSRVLANEKSETAPVNRNSIRSKGLLTGSFKESSRCRVIPADRPTLRAERQERGRHDFRREARSRLIRWKTKWVEWLRREL